MATISKSVEQKVNDFIAHFQDHTYEDGSERTDGNVLDEAYELLRVIQDECSRNRKGYIVVTEDQRSGYAEAYTYISDTVFTDLDEAMADFHETIENAKDEDADDDWLARALRESPKDIKEEWATERYVSYLDMWGGDRMNIYVHEVTIK